LIAGSFQNVTGDEAEKLVDFNGWLLQSLDKRGRKRTVPAPSSAVSPSFAANTMSVAPSGSMAASPRLIERVAMLRCILFKKGLSRHASSITSLSFFAFSTALRIRSTETASS
jgi:hypothetical protein